MPPQLLTTKLYIPPVRQKLVPRPRLIERLNVGLRSGHKLTLVSAPAGFGKTTLLSEWIHQTLDIGDWGLDTAATGQSLMPNTQYPKFAWLSLDEGDNDLTRFLSYFVAALQTIKGNVGEGLLAALQSPGQVNVEAVLTALLNEVSGLSNNFTLVLDDYHVIESPVIDQALTFLLDHLPLQMHLVIATRTDPTLPLSRLRARGRLTEMRSTDLRFTTEEAAAFLKQVVRLPISPDDVRTLEDRTEGWITGLQLAAVAMQGLEQREQIAHFIHSFGGSHRYVIDYLVDEVLGQQTPQVQRFLLQTSILDRITASLCNAVRFGIAETPSGCFATAVASREDSQAVLEKLEAANLFLIPLDGERRWYRYHHLFADLLRQRLRQNLPEQVPGLHCRASEWYEQNGFADEAIEHALRAEDFERTASLIEAHVDALWNRDEHTQLRRWLAQLPIELVFSKPPLCILYAWDLFANGQQDAAERSLQAAEKALGSGNDLATASDKMRIRGRVAAIRAFLAFYRGDISAVSRQARQALEYLPEQDLTWRGTATVALGDAYSFAGDMAAAYQARLDGLEISKAAGNMYMSSIAGMKLAVTLRQQGRLNQVIDICQQQWQLAEETGLGQMPVIGWLLAIWGEVLAERNALDEALHQATKGVELTERGRDIAMMGWSYLCLIRVLFASGDLDGAQEIIQKMDDISQKHNVPPWLTSLIGTWQPRLWLAQGKLEATSQWVKDRGLDAGQDPIVLRENEYIALARILVAQGRLDEAQGLLRRLLQATEMGGRSSRMIEVLILQALAFQSGGNTNQALAALEQALSLAEPGGFVHAFVDEGPPMARLLYEAAARGIASDYARRLLAAFPLTEPEQNKPSTPQLDLVEPLSEREIQVLQLIAEGLTNQKIASRLFLTLNTVKSHSRNIYGKLNVHSRTQAIARAQALGLLPRG